MTSYFTLYILFIIHVTSGLKQFHSTEVLHIVENSCLFALTISDNDDVYKLQNEELLQTLSETTFSSEPAVHIGYINLETFIWPNNQHLKTKNNERHYDNNSNLVLFPKTKVDRTCLLTSKSPPPNVFVYKGAILINRLVDFINVHCDTFRTVKGSRSYEGLHREEIIKNLFTVESVSEVTSEQVFHTHLSDQEPCDKSEGHFCVKSEHSSVNYNDGKFNEMPKCERISMPTKDYFFHNYLKISKPVIIEGGAKMWPAMSKWSNKFLRETYGIHDVHIKLTPGGEFEGVESSQLWDNFRSFKIPDKVREQLEFPDLVVVRPATLNMKFSELVDLIENVSGGAVKNVSAYLEYSSIPDHLPDLEDDIEEMPFINDVLKREHLNIWFSDGNTLGKLHFDQFDNFLCQISGRKQVILFEPHDNTRLYEGHIPEAMLAYNGKEFSRKKLVDSTSMVMSPVDLAKVNFQRFPKFAETYPLNCTIEEGDVLFMPSFWWHEVQSFPNKTAKRNLAVNFWYDPFLTKEFPCPTCKLDINPHYRHLL